MSPTEYDGEQSRHLKDDKKSRPGLNGHVGGYSVMGTCVSGSGEIKRVMQEDRTV